MSDTEDFRVELTKALMEELKANHFGIMSTPWQAKQLINAITKGWSVTKDMNHFTDAWGVVQDATDLVTDPGPEDQQVPLTVFRMTVTRPQTVEERAEIEAKVTRITDLAKWKYGAKPYKTEPPQDVSLLDLLEQRRWWVTQGKQVLRVKDMHPAHQANVLALLRRKATQLYLAYSSSHIWHDAPDDVLASLDNRNPHEWLGSRPLVKKLAKLVERR